MNCEYVRVKHLPGGVVLESKTTFLSKPQLVRVSTSGLCRAERYRFEPQFTRGFLSAPLI